MPSCLNIAFAFAFSFGACSSLQYAAFDTATASSVYTGRGEGFAAGHALSTGSSYWCSAGNHGQGQVVSWTGVFAARRQAAGVYLSWSYSPSEIQILASPDGSNFVEAACWRPSSQTDASYVEHVMFDRMISVRAVTVVMRGPRTWGYFALNSVTLLAEPGPAMLVSGLTAPNGEMCAVANNGDVSLMPCIEAVAAGTGTDMFHLAGDGLLMSKAFSNECAALADGDAAGGGHITMGSCNDARRADDGRAVFRATATGQLRLAFGNSCVIAQKEGLAVQDCSSAGQSPNAADKFFFVAVPEFDPSFADAARASAQLARKTSERLEGLLTQLNESVPALASCLSGHHLAPHYKKPAVLSQTHSTGTSRFSVHDQSTAAAATKSMIEQLKVGSLADVIARARTTIADVRRQF